MLLLRIRDHCRTGCLERYFTLYEFIAAQAAFTTLMLHNSPDKLLCIIQCFFLSLFSTKHFTQPAQTSML